MIVKINSDIPLMGMIFFSNEIETSKLTVEYLTPLMLHHFIRLLGFSYQVIPSSSYEYYELNADYYPNVIDYAMRYFGCDLIYAIILSYNSYEGFYYNEGSSYTLYGLYWPKRFLLGELLTEFEAI